MNEQAMDFFAHQERARRRTATLVLLFAMGVAAIIAVIYLAFTLTFFQRPAWDPVIFAWVAGGALLVILSGSLFETLRLSGGGAKVAEMLGGRPVDPGTTDPGERRLLNVVDEMAIASGIPPPRVYLLDAEEGINAFAAGFDPKDAVIGVTGGAVRILDRDELQGVIAHEFSHILHGDMRLNQRLMGLVFGILLIALMGQIGFRFTSDIMLRSRRSRSDKKGSGVAVVLGILLFSLVIMAIGYIGVFFGRLVKSAASRQREFLADAAAVQFTRNPDGLAGALRKIRALATGGRLKTERAEEASHMFFADGLSRGFARWMATHPDIDERIRRIDPSFHGAVPGPDYNAKAPPPVADAGAVPAQFAPAAPRAAEAQASPKSARERMGSIDPERLDRAHKLMASLPASLALAARDPAGARRIVYGLLLSHEPGALRKQLEHMEQSEDSQLAEAVRDTAAHLKSLAPELKLPLLDLALPAMRSMSRPEYVEFRSRVQAMVEADSRIDLFEYALQRMLFRNLAPYFEKSTRAPGHISDPAAIAGEFRTLLSTLAYYGAPEPAKAEAAFIAGWARFSKKAAGISPASECGLAMVDEALSTLSDASLPLKRSILDACVETVSFDNHAELAETQLLRAVADALDCPMPAA
ncbi:MAG: M48 family metallopeptidase [Lentisphaerae bacterium]|nr:M48 family metallopeptidase [Lentisphaerota bacterium]